MSEDNQDTDSETERGTNGGQPPVGRRRVAADGGHDADFFEQVVERVGVGVAVYGSDGRFTYVNDAYADLLGRERADLLEMHIWEVNPAVDADQFADYWASFAVDETRQRETVHRRADGTELPVETHTTAVEIDGRRYNVGTIADISERVEGWAAAERQDERIEEFASVVSHDLRNPLNVAMGRLELAREETDSDHLDAVATSLCRMEELIDDVLTLARQGDRITDPERVHVDHVVESAWDAVPSGSATLEVVDDLGVVESDESRLREVFENLFANAVRHGGDGVTVTVGRTEGGLYVADDGPGIPESDREDVFEHGYSTDPNGTGFGLAIVEEIVDAHGWEITAGESESGGARFDICGVAFA